MDFSCSYIFFTWNALIFHPPLEKIVTKNFIGIFLTQKRGVDLFTFREEWQPPRTGSDECPATIPSPFPGGLRHDDQGPEGRVRRGFTTEKASTERHPVSASI